MGGEHQGPRKSETTLWRCIRIELNESRRIELGPQAMDVTPRSCREWTPS
jgi:hypothetical protein